VRGTDNQTGKALSGFDHLKQSIRDILSTPIGTRVMLRDYGSRLFELVDAPLNRGTIVEIYVATIEALVKWEPRLRVSRVIAESITGGKITLTLEGTYLPNGQPVTLEGIVV
jgi:hypothetical protein